MSEKQQVLPFQPIIDRLRDPDHTDTDFAVALGVTRDILRTWTQNGIRFYVADKLVTRLGYHPSYFWPDEYWLTPLGESNE